MKKLVARLVLSDIRGLRASELTHPGVTLAFLVILYTVRGDI